MSTAVDRFGLSGQTPGVLRGIVAALLTVAVVTLLIFPLREVVPVVSTGVTYLLAVLLVATYWGIRAGFLTAVLATLAFNFFHLPPTGGLTVTEGENVVALAVFLVTALIAGTVADQARARAVDAEEGRRKADEAAAVARALLIERERLTAEAVEAGALRRSDELKTALLRSVSHDLRTPLTSIVAAADALASPGIDEDERAELAGSVGEAALHLSRMVDQLLDLSRLEAGAANPRREWSSLQEVVDAAARQVSGTVASRLEPDLPLINADAAQLERAFVNVLENAVAASGSEPVTVSARTVGSHIVLRVVDRGPGIPADDLARIFEPFYRGEAAGDAARTGSGLGLAIARGFVVANGGTIRAESLPGQGAAIVIELPVEPQPDATKELSA